MKKSKIMIGVTQFGLNYGIMNKSNLNKKKVESNIKFFKKKLIHYILQNIMAMPIKFLHQKT